MFLNAIEDEQVKLFFQSNKSPCIITGIENNSYNYLVLPINPRE